MPRTTVAAAPTIWATMRPANEIQAERTLSFFFFFFFSAAAQPLRLRPERTATAEGRSKGLGDRRVPRCPCNAHPNLPARSANARDGAFPRAFTFAPRFGHRSAGRRSAGRQVRSVTRRTRAARCGESSTCPNRPAEARGSSDRCWGLPRSRPSRRRPSGQVSGPRAPVEQRAPVPVGRACRMPSRPARSGTKAPERSEQGRRSGPAAGAPSHAPVPAGGRGPRIGKVKATLVIDSSRGPQVGGCADRRVGRPAKI